MNYNKNYKNNPALCHGYRYKESEHGRASSIFFERDTLYSFGHHFAICKRIEAEQETYLFTATLRGWGSYAAKHIGHARQALQGARLVLCNDPDATPAENFVYWQTYAKRVMENLARARKPEIYILELASIARQSKIYAEATKTKVPAALKKITSITTEQAREATKKIQEQRQKQEERRRHQRRKDNIKAARKFFNFETVTAYGQPFDLLRYNKDSQRIETSKAVQVPKEIALKFYGELLAGNLHPGSKILSYSVTEITEKVIVIGCHTLKLCHIHATAKKLQQCI